MAKSEYQRIRRRNERFNKDVAESIPRDGVLTGAQRRRLISSKEPEINK